MAMTMTMMRRAIAAMYTGNRSRLGRVDSTLIAARGQAVGQAGRFGQAIAAQRALHPGQRGIGADPVAAGHEERLAADLAAQHPAQQFVAVQQRRMRTGLGTGFFEAADQLRLRHADSGQVGHHAQM